MLPNVAHVALGVATKGSNQASLYDIFHIVLLAYCFDNSKSVCFNAQSYKIKIRKTLFRRINSFFIDILCGECRFLSLFWGCRPVETPVIGEFFFSFAQNE
jgi:hypothetical protein